MKNNTGTITIHYASAPSLFGGLLEVNNGESLDSERKAIEKLRQDEIQMIKELGINPMDLITATNHTNSSNKPICEDNTQKTWETLSSEYLEVLGSNRRLSDLTIAGYKAAYVLVPFILGKNRTIISFTNEDMKLLYEGLGCIPSSYKSYNNYKNMSFSQLKILKLPKDKLPSISTRNNKFGLIKAVFENAVTQGLITRNVANVVEYIKDQTPNNEKRELFDTEDLRKIFTHEHYTENKWKNVASTKTPDPYTFWLFPLALFTGARMNELLQLKKENIGQTNNIWYIDFKNEYHPKTGKKIKSVKNTNSIRRIPISDALIALGFVKFALSSKNGYLFPEVYKRQNPKTAAQKQLSTRLDQMKVRILSKKSFHSLRHTFINHAINQGAANTYIGGITGHLDKKDFEAVPEIAKTYFKGYPVDVLKKEVIDKLDYDVDFSAVQWCY